MDYSDQCAEYSEEPEQCESEIWPHLHQTQQHIFSQLYFYRLGRMCVS